MSFLLTAMRRMRRLGWGIADQGLSSATNFALSLVAARTLTNKAFGGFALAFAGYLVAQGLSRALATEPMMVRFSGASDRDLRDAASQATGAALCCGFVGGIVMACIGLTQAGELRGAFLGLSPFVPGLLLQDAWRFVAFTRHRGHQAFLNDLVWAIALVPLLVTAIVSHRSDAAAFAFVWGASGSLAGLFGIRQMSIVPAIGAVGRWWGSQRELIHRFALEFGLLVGASQAVLYDVAYVAGLTAVGQIRAAQIVMGPIGVIFMGSVVAAIPEAARIRRRSISALRRVCLVLSMCLSIAPLLWFAGVAILGDDVLRGVLGEKWTLARPALLPIALFLSGSGLVAGAAVGLRAMVDARRSLHARAANACLVLVGAACGSALGGGVGASWGLCLSVWISAVFWWTALGRSLRESPLTTELIGVSEEPLVVGTSR